MKRSIIILGIVVIAVVGAFLIYKFAMPTDSNSEGEKFHNEYSLVDDNNVFIYKNVTEIINILEGGTGIVYLGFPECPWCQQYVKYLDDLAKKHNVKEIYYYNIKEIRNNNTENYKKIVSLLEDYLPYDDSGNKRVYVPNVTFVKNGEILANDNETSLISDGTTPSQYWTQENLDLFNDKMNINFEKFTGACSICN